MDTAPSSPPRMPGGWWWRWCCKYMPSPSVNPISLPVLHDCLVRRAWGWGHCSTAKLRLCRQTQIAASARCTCCSAQFHVPLDSLSLLPYPVPEAAALLRTCPALSMRHLLVCSPLALTCSCTRDEHSCVPKTLSLKPCSEQMAAKTDSRLRKLYLPSCSTLAMPCSCSWGGRQCASQSW